MLFVQSTLAT